MAKNNNKAPSQGVEFVLRPFEGLPNEADWVAMRDLIPAARAQVKLTEEYGGKEITVATLLPMNWLGLHRSDGKLIVALQTNINSGDASRDIAEAILQTLELEEGTPLTHTGLPQPGPRLQDILDLDFGFAIEVLDGFDYWIAPEERDAQTEAALEDANSSIVPTVRVSPDEHAYWVRMGDKEFLRWVRAEDEQRVLDALARLHAERDSAMGAGNRFVGYFRTHGIVIPVWDLVPGTEAEELVEPLAEFKTKFEAALAADEPLTGAQRRARAGLVARQLTLR